MRKVIAIVLGGGLLMGVLGPAAAKPKTVWEDAAGDAGNQDSALPGFDQAGFDLVSGAIERKGANLEFTVTHAQMLPTGTVPEAFRFLWNIFVDKTPYRFTVKRADVGKPDVGARNGTERIGRADVNGHFRLEGECVTDSTLPVGFVNCPPLEYLEGRWEPDKKSFTIVVPLKAIKAKPGTAITFGGVENICGICWVTHYAERSLSPTTIIDSAAQTVTYKVPK